MNCWKPATLVGGGEMKRATSSVESMLNSDGASSTRSSRSVIPPDVRTGSAWRQSEVATSAAGRAACGVSTRAGRFTVPVISG